MITHVAIQAEINVRRMGHTAKELQSLVADVVRQAFPEAVVSSWYHDAGQGDKVFYVGDKSDEIVLQMLFAEAKPIYWPRTEWNPEYVPDPSLAPPYPKPTHA